MWNELLNQVPFAPGFRDRDVPLEVLTGLLEAARQTATAGEIGWRYVQLGPARHKVTLLAEPDPALMKAPAVFGVFAIDAGHQLDAARSVQSFILAAAQERLGVRLSTALDMAAVKEAAAVPERWTPVCVLGVGHPERSSDHTTSQSPIPLSRMAARESADHAWPEDAATVPRKTMDIPVSIRFRDLDAMGHVNNATYATLLEEARIGFRNRVTEVVRDPQSFNSVVAENRIRYIRSITLGEPIVVRCWISDIRKHSYHFNYRICNGDTGEVKAEAMTVMVGFDYKTQQVQPVDPSFIKVVAPYTV